MKLKACPLTISLRAQGLATSVLSSGGRILGSFDHFSGMLEFYYKEGWPNRYSGHDEFIAFGNAHINSARSDEERAVRLLEFTASFHEMRHFHDCYFTPVGVALLEQCLEATQMLHVAIWAAIQEAKERGPSLTMPIRNWITAFGSARLRTFATNAELQLQNFAYTLGAEPIATLPGHDHDHDLYFVSLVSDTFETQPIPCTFCNLVVNDEPCRSLWPLGFSVFVECLALIEQESYSLAISPGSHRLIRRHLAKQDGPYLPLIVTFNRIFARHNVVSHLTNGLIYEIAWRCLFANSRETGHASFVSFDALGNELVHILSEYLHVRDDSVWWNPPHLDRARIITQKSFDQNLHGRFCRHVRDEYFAKAMKFDVGQVSYPTLPGYLYLTRHETRSLPKPPVIFTSRGDATVSDPEFFRLGQGVMLHRHIVLEAWFDSYAQCPIRRNRQKYLSYPPEVMPSLNTCLQSLRNQSCGITSTSEQYFGPACGWSHYLAELVDPQDTDNYVSAEPRAFRNW